MFLAQLVIPKQQNQTSPHINTICCWYVVKIATGTRVECLHDMGISQARTVTFVDVTSLIKA